VLPSGSSGSWIVRPDANLNRVYGVLVADDAFGDIYMVPLDDIMVDIRNELDADMVTLPHHSAGNSHRYELSSNDRMAAEPPDRTTWANFKRSGDEEYEDRPEDVAQRAEFNMNEESR
jgi:hypothetical protein